MGAATQLRVDGRRGELSPSSFADVLYDALVDKARPAHCAPVARAGEGNRYSEQGLVLLVPDEQAALPHNQCCSIGCSQSGAVLTTLQTHGDRRGLAVRLGRADQEDLDQEQARAWRAALRWLVKGSDQ